MNHYFIENPSLLTDERVLELEIFDMHFRFLANNGLFSCDKVDDASITLLKNIPSLKGTLLDLGCGYGTLGIVLGKKYGVELTMSDINSIALDYAVKNAELNRVNAIPVHSDSFANIKGKFDNIVLNPPIHAGKETMYRMYGESANHLTPGGALYIVIQKKHGAESTIKKLGDIFARVDVLYKKKGCFVVRGCV
ncbi:MAG: methyltransferase [Firmicutes bacterium]|nr:methyltransferase [Bacillota bacterium]